MLKRLRRTIQAQPSSPAPNNAATSEHGSQRSNKDETSGFICPMCMAGFKTPDELQIHFDKVHDEPIPGTTPTGSNENMTGPSIDQRSKAAKSESINASSSKSAHMNENIVNPGSLHAGSVKTTERMQNNPALNLTDDELSQGLQSNADGSNGKGDGALQQEISDLEASLQEEKWYSSELKSELEKIEAKNNSLKEEMNIIQQQMGIAIKTNEDLAREKEAVLQKLAVKSQECANIQSLCDEVKTEKQGQMEINKNQSVELEKAASWIRDLESQLVQRPGADDVLVLKKELVSVQTLMDQLTLESEKQKEAANCECTRLGKELKTLQEQYDGLKLEHDHLLVSSKDSQTMLEETKQKSASSTSELEEKYLKQLEKLEEELANSLTVLEKERLHYQTLEVENNSLREKILDLKEEDKKKEANFSRLSEEKTMEKVKCENQEQKINDMEHTKVQMQTRLEETLEKLEKAYNDNNIKMTEKNARIESLVRQCDDSAVELSALKKDVESLSAQKSLIQDDNCKLQEACKQLELDKSLTHQRHQAEIGEIQNLLAQANTSNLQLQTRVQDLESDVKQSWESMSQERSEAQSSVHEKEKQVMQLEMIKDKLQMEVEQCKNRISESDSKKELINTAMLELTEKLKIQTAENMSYIQKVESLERNIVETNAKLTEESSQKEAALEEVKRLQQERNDLTEKMEVGEGQAVLVGQLTDENESLRKRLEELTLRQKDLDRKQENIVQEYENSVLDLKTTIQQQHDVIASSDLTIKNLEDSISVLEKKDSQLVADLNAKSEFVMDLHEKLSGQKVAYEGQIALLQKCVDDKNKEFEKLSLSFETSKASSNALVEQMEKSRSELQERINKLQEENCRIAMRVKECDKIIEEKSYSVQEMKILCDDVKMRHQQELDNMRSRHAEKVSSLDSQVKTLQEQTIALNSELEGLHTAKLESEAVLVDISRQLKTAEANLASYSTMTESLRNELERTRANLSDAERHAEKLKTDFKSEKASLEKSHSDLIKNFKMEHAEETGNLEMRFKTLKEESNSKIKDFEGILEKKNDLLSTKDGKLSKMERMLLQKEEILTNLEMKVKTTEEKFEQNCKENEQKCNDLETKINSLMADKEKILKEAAVKEEMCISQSSSMKQLQGQLEQKDMKLKEVFTELGRKSDDLKQLNTRLEETSNKIVVLEETADKAKRETSDLQEINSELKTSLEMSRKTIDDMAKTSEETNQELEAVKKTLQEKEDNLSQLSEDYTLQQQEMMKISQNLSSELEKWKVEAHKSKISLEEKQKSYLEEMELWELTKMKMESNLELKQSEWTKEKEELLQSQETLKGAQQILINGKMELQKQLEKANQEVEQEKEKGSNLKNFYQEQKEKSESEICDMQTELEKITANLNEVKGEKQKTEARLQLEVGTLRDNLDIVRGEWQTAIAQADKANNESDELKGQIVVLQATVQNNADERRALLERCIIAEQGVEQLKANEVQLKRRLDDAQAAMHELGRENQAMQVKHTSVLSRQWADDKEAMECSSCRRPFTMTLRKHHCRHCGMIFCADCSSKSMSVAASKKPVRVCEKCFDDLLTVQ